MISVSIVEKSVDCPPTVPQYSCCTPFFPPYTTVFAPSSFAIVMLNSEQELAHLCASNMTFWL